MLPTWWVSRWRGGWMFDLRAAAVPLDQIAEGDGAVAGHANHFRRALNVK